MCYGWQPEIEEMLGRGGGGGVVLPTIVNGSFPRLSFVMNFTQYFKKHMKNKYLA